MLALAGIPLGIRFRFLDPSPDATAGALGELTVAPLDDPAALRAVAAGADVVTYEWEGVPAAGVRRLAERRTVLPAPVALEITQDRLRERELCEQLGIPTAEYAAVAEPADLEGAGRSVGFPSILKARRGGYDGKAQAVVRDARDLELAWVELGRAPSILEARVPFTRELSIIAVRGRDGSTACWPVTENRHVDGILGSSLAPAPGLEVEQQQAAEEIATSILDELGYVGVLAVELFEVGDRLLVNELAPRVHNSGHWTIEGAETSQFENHLRAIVGWPLGSTAAVALSAMVNCIGAVPSAESVLAIPNAHLHVYGKAPRPGRKVGHITVTAASEEELRDLLVALSGVEGAPGAP
jgi:5-(carboxyamino)imidazole ribonucleotide synthase